MTWTLPDGLTQLFAELGITVAPSKDMTTDLKNAATNDCSGSIDQTLPISLIAWNGYNHSATPAAPTLSVNPGDDSSPQADPQQDSHIYWDWPPVSCAALYDGEYSTVSATGPWNTAFSNQATESHVENVAAADTQRWLRVRSQSNLGDEGAWSAGKEGRTSPTSPQGLGSSDDADCADLIITVTWNNGTAPGVRDSIVKWRVQLNGGGYGAESATATGAVSFTYNPGAVNDGDVFDFELRYDEESTSTRVTESITISCPV